jgi:hypothetical protein
MARGETVFVVRPPGKARFGDKAVGAPQRFEVPNTLFAPGPSKEIGLGAGANQVDTEATVYPPPGIRDLVPGGPQPTDPFEVRGQLYQIVGDPQDWGRRNRMVIELKKVTG